jgi:hypothetical protein
MASIELHDVPSKHVLMAPAELSVVDRELGAA